MKRIANALGFVNSAEIFLEEARRQAERANHVRLGDGLELQRSIIHFDDPCVSSAVVVLEHPSAGAIFYDTVGDALLRIKTSAIDAIDDIRSAKYYPPVSVVGVGVGHPRVLQREIAVGSTVDHIAVVAAIYGLVHRLRGSSKIGNAAMEFQRK